MHIQPKCMPCLIGQVENSLRLLKPDIANDEIVEIQKQIMGIVKEIKEVRTPFYGQQIYKFLGEYLGTEDPYEALKAKYNQIALDLIPQIDTLVQNANDPLQTAIAIAILGNTIDFGTAHELNLEQELEDFSLDNLAVNEYPALAEIIPYSTNILVLGDNAGEIVFDKIMLELLHKQFPEKNLVYAVRGGPIINDATIIDANSLSLPDLCPIVEGAQAPGIILEQATEEYKSIFATADLIISKGQGNYESLDSISTPQADVFYLLKAKCELIAEIFQVPYKSLIFAHRPKEQ